MEDNQPEQSSVIAKTVAAANPKSGRSVRYAYSTAAIWIPRLLSGVFMDKVGRMASALLGVTLLAIMSFPAFFLMRTGDPLLVFMSSSILFTAHADFNAIAAITILVEKFPTQYRASGVGFTYALSFLVGGVFLQGMILPYILNVTGSVVNAWPYAASLSVITCVISFLAYVRLGETKGTDLETVTDRATASAHASKR